MRRVLSSLIEPHKIAKFDSFAWFFRRYWFLEFNIIKSRYRSITKQFYLSSDVQDQYNAALLLGGLIATWFTSVSIVLQFFNYVL